MKIGPFVKKEYFTIPAFQGTGQARKMIFEHGCAVVVSEDACPIGIITPYDLAACPCNLVIDCLTDKPKVTDTYVIPEVLEVMEKVHSDMLLVYNHDQLEGVIHKKDLTDYLCHSVEQQRNLVHSIAHDLKNPLSNMLSMTYLMEDMGSIEEQRELVSLAQDVCHYATGIINDLLVGGTDTKVTLAQETIDLNVLIEECIEFFKIPLEQKKLQLHTLIQTGGFPLKGDLIKLKRAICNLISNAVKFTREGGTVSVQVTHAGGKLLLAIKDTGVGIPPDMQDLIFDKFTVARRPGTNGEESTGLGMSITKQIILQHGGKIWLESQENQGTTFYIEFDPFLVV